MGLIAGYLYYSQTSETLTTSLEPAIDQELEALSKMKLDFSILEDKRYKSLEIFGENPVDPGVTGKRNIFAPI